MKSMTGFGEAKRKQGAASIEITLSSVNTKRGLDLNLSLPRELQTCEDRLRELIGQQVTRGRLNVQVSIHTVNTEQQGLLEVNQAAFKHYQKQFSKLARSEKFEKNVSLEFILKQPGVMNEPQQNGKIDYSELFEKTLQLSLKRYQASRQREGQELKNDLLCRLKEIDSKLDIVKERRPQVVKQHRQNLLRRLKQTGFPDLVNDERILKEVALFADRSDVSEEVTRLRAHLKEGRRLSGVKQPVGKSLDFLVQEIGREINTIGSKSNDLQISRAVLEMKAELEKVREQVQNIE